MSDIEETATLLQMSLDDTERKSLSHSLGQLIDYFEVMQTELSQEEGMDVVEETPPQGQGRADSALIQDTTETLIERSEEHESNFVVIPNVL